MSPRFKAVYRSAARIGAISPGSRYGDHRFFPAGGGINNVGNIDSSAIFTGTLFIKRSFHLALLEDPIRIIVA